MKIAAIPKSGRVGNVIYSKTRYGFVARQFTPPKNPRTPPQQGHRDNLRAVSKCWHALGPEQRLAWGRAAAQRAARTDSASRVRLSGYHLFVSLNTRRADLGLPQFPLPPAEPMFNPTPVSELAVTNLEGKTTVKLRVSGTPTRFILVQGPAPTRTGVRFVQHFPFLGLLPPPVDGWSDVTALVSARYGPPKLGTAIWLRTCQHIDGWTDAPKVLRARVPAATP